MDGVLESIGPFGLYQKCILLITGFSTILSAITIYSTVFTLAEPNLICQNKLTNETISDDAKCSIWKNLSSLTNKSSSIYECKYDTTYYNQTMVSDLNLICDRKFYANLLQTFYLLGTFSALAAGYFSDRFGRKKTIQLALILLNFILIFTQLVNFNIIKCDLFAKYIINSMAQFIIGATSCVLFSVCFILLIELTTSKYGNLVSTLNLYIYAAGEFIILLVAYYLKNWNLINGFLTLFGVVTLVVSFLFLPESPRFLLSRNRLEEAYEVVLKIKKVNQPKYSKQLDKEEILNNFKNLNNNDLSANENEKDSERIEKDKKNQIFALLKSKEHLVRILFLILIWFALTMSYYGVSLGITSIGDLNPYVTYFLSSVAEVIGYACCHLNEKFNRKKLLILFLSLTGVVCLSVTLIPTEQAILIIVFASIGKAMSAAAFNSSYVYTSQMFPTYARNTFFLFVSSIGRFGSIISPQVNLLQNLVWKPLPYIIFSSSSFIAGLLVFLLPDPSTLNYL